MNTQYRKFLFALGVVGATMLTSASGQVAKKNKAEPLMIQEQGSFAAGGKVITNPGAFNPKQPTPSGQTLHGDHAYVFYQVPVNPRKLPLVFLHGTGQFSKTWETTPDVRVFRLSFSVVAFRYISSISRVVAMRAAVPCRRR